MQLIGKNFYRPTSTTIILTVFVALLLWMKQLFIAPLPSTGSSDLLPEGIASILGSFFLVIITAYIFQQIVDKHNFLQNRSILPFQLFILFSSSQLDFLQVTTSKITLLLFSFVILEILSTYHQNEPVKKVYNASFLLSICIFLNFYFIALIPFLFISIYIINKITIRLLHAIGLGLLTPLIILIGYFYISGNIHQFYQMINLEWVLTNKIVFNQKLIYITIMIILGIISIRGIFYHQYQNNLQQRKNSIVIIWAFAFFAIIALIGINVNTGMKASLSAMSSLLTALYFSKNTSKKNSIFLLILVTIFIIVNILIGYGTFS